MGSLGAGVTDAPRLTTARSSGVRAQLLRFACIGAASTAAYLALYVVLRWAGLSAQLANAISLLVTTIANTAANRRITFEIRGRRHATRHQVQALIAVGAGFGLTSLSLEILHILSARPARITEVSVLVAANLVATAIRFVLYRSWVFRPRQA